MLHMQEHEGGQEARHEMLLRAVASLVEVSAGRSVPQGGGSGKAVKPLRPLAPRAPPSLGSDSPSAFSRPPAQGSPTQPQPESVSPNIGQPF